MQTGLFILLIYLFIYFFFFFFKYDHGGTLRLFYKILTQHGDAMASEMCYKVYPPSKHLMCMDGLTKPQYLGKSQTYAVSRYPDGVSVSCT